MVVDIWCYLWLGEIGPCCVGKLWFDVFESRIVRMQRCVFVSPLSFPPFWVFRIFWLLCPFVEVGLGFGFVIVFAFWLALFWRGKDRPRIHFLETKRNEDIYSYLFLFWKFKVHNLKFVDSLSKSTKICILHFLFQTPPEPRILFDRRSRLDAVWQHKTTST